MRDDLHRWQEDGFGVALVGSGNANFAQAFVEDFALDVPVFVDPELASFRAARLRRGPEAIASPRFLSNAARALGSGARQEGVQGDAWQLGGTFVFEAGGDLRFVHRSETSGDHADPDAIEEALMSNASTRASESGDAASSGTLVKIANGLRPILDWSPIGSFDRIGFERHALGFDPDDLDVDLNGKRCLVTGANSGLGYATALALAELGAEVHLLCRNETTGRDAETSIRAVTNNPNVELRLVDLSDLDDVDRLVETYGDDSIDVLIHNAGLLPDERMESAQGYEITFATHVAGPHRLTAGLRPNLEAAGRARIIWVSSGGMLTRKLQVRDPQWKKREYDGTLAYAETKRAQVVLSECWAEELAGTGVVSNSMHPGWADTPGVSSSLPNFRRVTEAILRTPKQGADTIIWLAAAEAAGRESGRFFFDREAVATHWLPMTRETKAEREALWRMCRELAARPRATRGDEPRARRTTRPEPASDAASG